MISFVLPTRDRPGLLAQTLRAISALSPTDFSPLDGAEVIVVDNASIELAIVPRELANGIECRVIRLAENQGAAARNVAVQEARGDWIIMLDDDSHPIDAGFVEVLMEAPDDVAAIGAEILLPDGRHEAGGLPEVFIGCGVAIRRDAFLDCGGYDPAFHYYAEEYDLAAKMLLRGWRVIHDFRFRVLHEKTAQQRDMNVIVHRLLRNNGWVAQRYAPSSDDDRPLSLAPSLQHALHDVITRYATMAVNERASTGFVEGMAELLATLPTQSRQLMNQATWDRFTGLAAARAALADESVLADARTVAVVDEGKNAWAVRQALVEMGLTIADESAADVLVISTLSPGPMLDVFDRRRSVITAGKPILMPWRPAGACLSKR